jgi:4-diphosphocytidyl-2-C-methyl-D-erythritol kinase
VRAFAKLNLSLVVGPDRGDGKHEVVTVLQAIDLHDEVDVEPHHELTVDGYAGDSLVGDSLLALAAAAGVAPAWRARIDKRIPVASGLGGGSSDAATALVLANALLGEPLARGKLVEIAAALGADVPFFLAGGTQLGTEDGATLEALTLPLDYTALVILPHGLTKASTAEVYASFDDVRGEVGFEERRAALFEALHGVTEATDLATLPRNDLASSRLTTELERLGALRADVTGAGPAVYGLFERRADAERAAAALADAGSTWITTPVAADRPERDGKMGPR